jgi:hypothetical protein
MEQYQGNKKAEGPLKGYDVTENEVDHWNGVWKRPQRVLGVQGSPRKKHGATEIIYSSFIEGMEAAGVSTTTVYLADIKFSPCAGCFKCWIEEGGQCIIRDDMDNLLPSVPTYDMMILATPLYVDGMSGLLKNFIDRLMPLNHPAIVTRDGLCLHPSRCNRLPNLALIAVCGFYEIDQFKPLVQHVLSVARNMHTPLVCKILRPESLSFKNPLAFSRFGKVTESLRAAGKELVEKGSINRRVMNIISQHLLTREQYMMMGSSWWEKGSKRGS